MSSLKKDVLSELLQYRAELKQGLNELAGHGTPEEQAVRHILNLIEGAVKKEYRKGYQTGHAKGTQNQSPQRVITNNICPECKKRTQPDIKSKLIEGGSDE